MMKVYNRVRTWGWRVQGPFIRALWVDRVLWKRRFALTSISRSWQTALQQIYPHAPFFEAVPYRPCFAAPFDEEKPLLSAALAVATHHYFQPNLAAYRRVVERVGSYLEHTLRTRPSEVRGSDVWIDYRHHKATLESILGRSDVAAQINSEIQGLCSPESGRPLDGLTYAGCTICCRLENLTPSEGYLIDAMDGQLDILARKFDDVPEPPPDSDAKSDLHARKFYIAMLRCKAQAYKPNPDVAIIRKSIGDAKASHEHIKGPATGTYAVVVPLYEALLSKCEQRPLQDTTNHYNASLAAFAESCVPYFCLLRVPLCVKEELANYVGSRMIAPDFSLEELKSRKIRNFAAVVCCVPLLVTFIPFLLLRYLVPSLSSSKTTWFISYALSAFLGAAVVLAAERGAERRSSGLVSPNAIKWADIVVWFLVALGVTLVSGAGIVEMLPAAP